MEETCVLRPIAHVHSEFPGKFGIPRQSGVVPELRSELIFTPEFRNPDALRGIEGFDRLWLIWEFSANRRASWSPTVRPPRLGGNTRLGVFATRSPFRPNPLGMSCVVLTGVRQDAKLGPVLCLSGADLMDGTPGKHSDRMVEWIRRRWRGNVRFETDTLASLLPHIVTCPLHDNHGFDDEHLLAGDGTIDWPALFGRLAGAPRLRSLQNEANMAACRIAPRRAVERFRALGRREARLHA